VNLFNLTIFGFLRINKRFVEISIVSGAGVKGRTPPTIFLRYDLNMNLIVCMI
jgi:hypothetical protein